MISKGFFDVTMTSLCHYDAVTMTSLFFIFTVHSIFNSQLQVFEFFCHSVVELELFWFSLFLAISVVDQTPFFNSTLNLANSTTRILTIKSCISINLISKGKGIVTAMTLISSLKWVMKISHSLRVSKNDQISSKLNWFLELMISFKQICNENF